MSAAQKKAIYKTVIGLCLAMVVIFGLFLNKLFTPRVMSKQELRANGAIVFDTPRLIKDFELLDHNGETFALENLQGKWTLAFFGFTHCPDICPATLLQLSQVYKKLNDDIREETQVILVSLDPARDHGETLAQYVNHFHSDFVGVTGDFIQIKRLANNLNVAFSKVVQGDDYTVDHTGNIFLINPKGHYHGFIRPPFELARLKGIHQSLVTAF